jgi:acyl phosphate:glycerol-3-phosphate acyltransferase
MIFAKFAITVVLSYLFGSIPFGVIIGRLFANVDVRNYGSGKMGATNVMRVAGKKAAVIVFVCDLFKGVLAVSLAWIIFRGGALVVPNSADWWMVKGAPAAAALAAMIGHTWPIFLKFKGGRGVATFYGGLAVLCPPAFLIGGQITLLSAGLTRYVSLGSIAGAIGAYAVLLPLTIFNGYPIELLLYSLAGTIGLIISHRDNIERLVAGTERRLGERKNEAVEPPSKNITG